MVLVRIGAKFKMMSSRTNNQKGQTKLPQQSEEETESEESDTIILPDVAPRQMTLDYLLGTMPQPEQRLMEGNVQKHGMDGALHARHLVLTADAFFIASSKDGKTIKDCIPLLEIIAMHQSGGSAGGDLALALESGQHVADGEETALEGGNCGPPCAAFEIHTRQDGDCSGVSYLFTTESPQACRAWRLAAEAARNRLRAHLERIQRISSFTIYQRRARRAYNSMAVQMTVAALVFLNFLATAAQVPHPLPRQAGNVIFD
jgi:hypothetical protein